jgi:hypothetical protein
MVDSIRDAFYELMKERFYAAVDPHNFEEMLPPGYMIRYRVSSGGSGFELLDLNDEEETA